MKAITACLASNAGVGKARKISLHHNGLNNWFAHIVSHQRVPQLTTSVNRADKLLDSSSKHVQLMAMPHNLASIIHCRFLLQSEYSNDKVGH